MKKITFLLVCLFAASLSNAQFASMSITGDGAGGWPGQPGNPGPVDIHQMTSTDGVNWSFANLITSLGSVKFRAVNDWANNWGAASGQSNALTGTGVLNSPDNISTVAGIYNVTFNSTTLAYAFTPSNIYPIISLVGPAAGGWDTDIDMSTTDGIHYSSSALHLVAGAVKWRQNHSWSDASNVPTNWGASAFPSGTAVYNDPGAVDVPDGTYNITFNKTTLEYSFAYPSIALVGAATATGWPTGAPGEVDAQQMSTTDGITYTIPYIVLTTNAGKFRMNNSWQVQWGASTTPGFPNGVGTQNGGDINMTAGPWTVNFNRVTGAYGFADALGVATQTNGKFIVFPNPTVNNWNFSNPAAIDAIEITDVMGKIVKSVSPKSTLATVDASQLSNGVYFAKVISGSQTEIVKLIKN